MEYAGDIFALLSRAAGLDPVASSLEDYKLLFNQIATGHIFSTIIPKGGFWYRVRKNSHGALYENTRELWYPPPDKILLLGRANEPHHPVLYLSEDGAVALRETNFSDGDLLTVVECEVLPPFTLRLQEIGILENSRKQSLVSLSESIQNRISNAHRHGYGNMRHQQAVRDYFVREFTRPVEVGNEHGYKASAALSSILLSRTDCDGLAYPAMRSAKLDVNLALKPGSADEKLKIRRVDVVQSLKLPNGEIAVRRHLTSTMIGADGSICYAVPSEASADLPWVSARFWETPASK